MKKEVVESWHGTVYGADLSANHYSFFYKPDKSKRNKVVWLS